MKKIFCLVVSILLLAGTCYAEIGAVGYSNNTQIGELTQYIYAYNNSGSSIASNSVVILDTTAANVSSGSTLGARITATTTAGSQLAIGITDETIPDDTAGRVCVRGPHKALFATTTGPAAVGATLHTTTTSGYLARHVSDATSPSVAVMLSATTIKDDSTQNTAWENADNFWVWVQR